VKRLGRRYSDRAHQFVQQIGSARAINLHRPVALRWSKLADYAFGFNPSYEL
jgi:hypothetical protein